MPDKKEIIVRKENESVASVSSFISQALEQKVPIETLERLLAMHKEVREMQAKEAFVQAMSKFQGECPVVVKDKKIMNKDGMSVRSRYADLGSIVSVVKGILAKHGLSYTFYSEFGADFITVTCVATHEMGHSEKSQFKLPVGEEAFMSQAQKFGARVTFGRRYAFCDVFGILTGDEDTDDEGGQESEAPVVKPEYTKEQVAELIKKIENAKDIKEVSDLYMGSGQMKLVVSVIEAKGKKKDEFVKAEKAKA